ncbi:MAG: SCO1664 family protein, partial [Mycobacteriales bacterium]
RIPSAGQMSDRIQSRAETEHALRARTLKLRAQIRTGNNAVFVADVLPAGEGSAESVRCIYKPIRGERALWDFPDRHLAPREVAAYLVDCAAGWELVPPTVLRDWPFGPGSCQLWIPHLEGAAPSFDVCAVDEVPAGWRIVATGVAEEENEEPREVALAHADDPRLARMALFDAVINNADRKAGHVLPEGGRLWAIDHGVSFHSDPKLRTVLWGWAGEPLPEGMLEALRVIGSALAGELGAELVRLLSDDEIVATKERVSRLLAERIFPLPNGRWPALPYPLF